jgi:hypothetical protein
VEGGQDRALIFQGVLESQTSSALIHVLPPPSLHQSSIHPATAPVTLVFLSYRLPSFPYDIVAQFGIPYPIPLNRVKERHGVIRISMPLLGKKKGVATRPQYRIPEDIQAVYRAYLTVGALLQGIAIYVVGLNDFRLYWSLPSPLVLWPENPSAKQRVSTISRLCFSRDGEDHHPDTLRSRCPARDPDWSSASRVLQGCPGSGANMRWQYRRCGVCVPLASTFSKAT